MKKYEKELNSQWQFRQASGDQIGDCNWREAKVPGNIHLDLLVHNIIEDPYWRDNETSQQWIGDVDWEYQTVFSLTDSDISGNHCELIFDGLDTYADVYLNDQLILTADNMYSGWVANIGNHLKSGDNILRIYFHSVVKKTLPLYENNGFVLPANTSQPEPKLSVYNRKPGYHFGWDWGPRLVTCGVWRPITLSLWRKAKIESVQFIQNSLSSDMAELQLSVELDMSMALVKSSNSNLSLRLYDDKQSFEPITIAVPGGADSANVNFSIVNPELWWTVGLGEQPLYQLTLELLYDGKVVDQWQHRVGLRTLELIHEDDEHGKGFFFKLNGEPLYIKGSNCIPADFFVPRLTKADYQKMLGYAVDANMNMLRLWGGAIYEEKVFYDLCDELGVLVWQDFMFACAAYPCDDAMAKRIEWEAEYNIKRIRNHTSLALWCGNNEIAEGWHTWGWQKRYDYSEETTALVWKYYERIFHDILPAAVTQFDPSRAYWASSPKFGFVDERAKTDGDMHYWGVWFLGHKREQFEEYLPRFMSEYGLQSMPEIKTIEAFSLPEDWDFKSKVMVSHQKQYANPSKNQFLDGYGMVMKYLEREYCTPSDFEQLAYVSQLLQADYLSFAIKTHRRNRPYCMGTMYWQLNDMWPVTSWASVDYFGRWKASHYAIRETYKPLIVTVSDDGDHLLVTLVSDHIKERRCNIELELKDFSGLNHFQKSIECVAEANTSTQVIRLNKNELVSGLNSHKLVFVARCSNSDSVSQDNFYFHYNNELQLEKPSLLMESSESDGCLTIRLTTDTLVKNLFVKVDQHLDNNYFDLMPGNEVMFDIEPNELDQIEFIHYQMCASGSLKA